MIRIITPKGKMLYVDHVQPVCEMQVQFNGKRIVMMDPAKDWTVMPTALALKPYDSRYPNRSDELLVGNLKPELVLEIIRALGAKEFYDFSALSYQAAEDFEKVTLDKGKSAAYSNCTTNMCIGDFCGGAYNNFCDYRPAWDDLCQPVFPLSRPWEMECMPGMQGSVLGGDAPHAGESIDWSGLAGQ